MSKDAYVGAHRVRPLCESKYCRHSEVDHQPFVGCGVPDCTCSEFWAPVPDDEDLSCRPA
jgi:hypothetical protein